MNWKGVFPAVTTKFHADGSLDMNLFFKNLDFQLASGVHGIILGGTLGESSVLSQEEKITLTRETVNYINGRVPVILNIAEGATKDALFWAKKAEEIGRIKEKTEGIVRALSRGKLTIEEIAEDSDTTVEFVLNVKKEYNL